MHALLEDFRELGVAVGMSKEGIVLELPNQSEGIIPATLDLKLKSLDFDTVYAVELFQEEQRIKEQNKKQRNKDRKASYAQAVKARKQ